MCLFSPDIVIINESRILLLDNLYPCLPLYAQGYRLLGFFRPAVGLRLLFVVPGSSGLNSRTEGSMEKFGVSPDSGYDTPMEKQNMVRRIYIKEINSIHILYCWYRYNINLKSVFVAFLSAQ